MTVRKTQGTPKPFLDAKALLQQAATRAVEAAIHQTPPAGAAPEAPKEANEVSGHVERMRGIKRGGTGPLPWEGAVATAAPEAVQQAEGKNTCAAANKQRAMAEHNPAHYKQMVRDLERTGEAVLPNGEKLKLSPANRLYIDSLPGLSPEERENMKVQAALMDYANGGEDYDMESDLSIKDDGKTHKGLTARQAKRLDKLDNSTETATPEELQNSVYNSRNIFMRMLQAVFEKFGYSGPGFVSAVSDVVRDVYKRSKAEGRDFSIALNWPGGDTPTHMVTITNVDNSGNVTVRDTHGEHTYTPDQFADLLPHSDDTDVGTDTSIATTSTSAGRRR